MGNDSSASAVDKIISKGILVGIGMESNPSAISLVKLLKVILNSFTPAFESLAGFTNVSFVILSNLNPLIVTFS